MQSMQEVSRVAQVTATLNAPVAQVHRLPVIDPKPLSRAQRRGRRCAVPNCQRLLADLAYQVGCLPGGQPVLVCEDCAPPFSPVLTRGIG
jgi:hypothetical protein